MMNISSVQRFNKGFEYKFVKLLADDMDINLTEDVNASSDKNDLFAFGCLNVLNLLTGKK